MCTEEIANKNGGDITEPPLLSSTGLLGTCDYECATALSFQVGMYVDEAVKVFGISGGGGPINRSTSSLIWNGS